MPAIALFRLDRERPVSHSFQEVHPASKYIGGSFWGPCGLDPHTLSFTLTVRLADGTAQQFSDTLTKGVDDWRLYGPFDLAPPLP